MKRGPIVLTGGGTAGHITPLIAVAKEIIKLNPEAELVYIGKRGDVNESIIHKSGLPIKIHNIYAGKYRRYPSQNAVQKLLNIKAHALNFKDIFSTIIGLLQAFYLILIIKPSVVFTKGSFVGVPVGFAAGLLKKRLISHDSDVVPGLANKLISRFVSVHCVALEGNFPYKKDKIRVVGIPIRDEYLEYTNSGSKVKARTEINLPIQSKILFIGGSTQGSKSIDNIIEKIVPELLSSYKDLNVIHVFGRLNEESLKTRYNSIPEELRTRLHLHTFLHDNYRYMAAADVLVGRAGATFLAEVSMLSSAAIIIPAPQLTGGHQIENAIAYSKKGAVILIEENKITKEILKDNIVKLLNSSKLREELGKNANELSRANSALMIANILLEQ